MLHRKQFTFYRSFYEAISRIQKTADRLKAYDTVIRYALDGEEPDLDTLSQQVVITFLLIKPTLDSARRKAEAGKRGGEAGSKQEANGKQTASKGEIEYEIE